MFVSPPRLFVLFLACCLGLTGLFAAPVQFKFAVQHDPAASPFARDIWAEIETATGQRLRLPAYYDGSNTWAVRTRATIKGTYTFLRAEEVTARGVSPLSVSLRGSDKLKLKEGDGLGPPLRIDPRTGRSFVVGSSNRLYVPLGGNLPWPTAGSDTVGFYEENLSALGRAGLNWSRILMSHWSGLDLDWATTGATAEQEPVPGMLDLEAARRWDRIVAAAEASGVRLQIVLQQHSQLNSDHDGEWAQHPWSTANGGWLDNPTAFFSDAQALQLTRDKYRYIVARWGYSSSILAWELLHEAQRTDARRGDATAQAAIASWHTTMARHLRRYDVHRHLVTTNDTDLNHPLWAAMDYYQPHLYATNMMLGVQTLASPPIVRDRPIFYGAIGDERMAGLTATQQANGAALIPLAWAGLFADTSQPAQLWDLTTLRQNGRTPELAAWAAFANASGLTSRNFGPATSPSVLGSDNVPWRLTPGRQWVPGPNPDITLPASGAEGPELMALRSVLSPSAAQPPSPYPSRITLHFRSPAATNARLDLAGMSTRGSSLRLTLDGRVLHDASWPAVTTGQPVPTDLSIPFRLGYGDHTLVIENPTGPDWLGIAGLELGLPVNALVARARQAADRTVLWVYHRNQLFAPAEAELAPATGTVQLTDVPAGRWQLTWWNPLSGNATDSSIIDHPGGLLQLTTPPIARHAAAWLEPATTTGKKKKKKKKKD